VTTKISRHDGKTQPKEGGTVGLDEVARGLSVDVPVTFRVTWDVDSTIGETLADMTDEERAELLRHTLEPALRDAIEVSNEGREDFIVGLRAP
jgi:hypothetical protein